MELFEKWTWKAERDLASAKGLIDLEHFDTAIYHCQQAIEKIMKAYIVKESKPLPKTHSLLYLYETIMEFDDDICDIEDEILEMNGLDVEYRYPSDKEDFIFEPTVEEMNNAYQNAELILKFIKSKII